MDLPPRLQTYLQDIENLNTDLNNFVHKFKNNDNLKLYNDYF